MALDIDLLAFLVLAQRCNDFVALRRVSEDGASLLAPVLYVRRFGGGGSAGGRPAAQRSAKVSVSCLRLEGLTSLSDRHTAIYCIG